MDLLRGVKSMLTGSVSGTSTAGRGSGDDLDGEELEVGDAQVLGHSTSDRASMAEASLRPRSQSLAEGRRSTTTTAAAATSTPTSSHARPPTGAPLIIGSARSPPLQPILSQPDMVHGASASTSASTPTSAQPIPLVVNGIASDHGLSSSTSPSTSPQRQSFTSMIGRRLSTGSFRLALGLGSANSASGAHAPGASTLGTSTHAIGLPAGPATFTIVAQHQQQRAASAHHQHHVRDPDALDDIGAVDDGHTGRPGADGSESRRGASATTSAAGGAALDPANAAMQSASDLRNRPDPGYRAPAGEPFKFKLVPYNPFFPTVERELAEGVSVPVGRHQKSATAPGSSSSDAINGVFYKSTVVSRKHASFAVRDGRLYLSDCKSLGGTFVNAIRLAPASKESEPVPLFHGDIIQFGVDYRPDVKTGQVRNRDKCIEVRIEFPRLMKGKRQQRPPRWNPAQHQHTECCICISGLYTKQAIFIAPCTHTFHYRCIAPLLRGKGFSCPMCRTMSNIHEPILMMDATIASDEESDDGDADAVSNGANARSPTTANASPTKSPLSETALEERASRVAVQLDACSSSSDESVRQRMEADDPRMEADDEMAMGGVPVVAAAAVSRPGTTTTHAAGSTNEVQEQTDKRDSE